ncbi:MAG: hypothetical protein QOK15_1365 [Nocardioidaceae bacterium]|nr:hypothetical protein [Nocardioidaceae bacterium]
MAELVALAGAAALSTVPVTATLFLLLSERRRSTAFPFLAGTVIGTVAALTLGTLLTQALPGRPHRLDSLIGELAILIGSALVVLGLITLLRVRRDPTVMGRPDWLENIGSLGAVPCLGIGLALNLRPKAVLLVAAASLAIRSASINLAETLIAIAVYTVVATSTVVIPILATALFPQHTEPRLRRARDWITTHGAWITGSVMVLIGVLVMLTGVTR